MSPGPGKATTDAEPHFRSLRGQRVFVLAFVVFVLAVAVFIIGFSVYLLMRPGELDPVSAINIRVVWIVPAAVLIACIWAPLHQRAMLRPAAKANPGSLVFITANSPQLKSQAEVLSIALPKRLNFVIAVSELGFEIWPSGAKSATATIPWSSISRALPGQQWVVGRRGAGFIPAIHLISRAGDTDVDLGFPVLHHLVAASVRYCDKVLAAVQRHVSITETHR